MTLFCGKHLSVQRLFCLLPIAAGLLLVLICLPITVKAQVLPQASSAQMGTGGIRGLITDSDGALVGGAQIHVHANGKQHSTTSEPDGRFSLNNIPAGSFELNVFANDLAPASVTGSLAAGQILELPAIQLRVASASTSVDVNLTRQEMAQADVEEEEKQRAFGIVPNFLVSYNRNFTPLDAKQKFGLGFHVILDPTHFAFAAIAAGIQTAYNQYPGYGQDAAGFGQRYGAALATTTTSTILRASVFPSIFHQDPRYFYRGTGSNWSRAGYAVSTAFISKGDNGKWQPAYASLAANFSAGALSRYYYAPSDRKGASIVVENSFLAIGGVAVGHLAQEFLFARITKHGKHLPPVPPPPVPPPPVPPPPGPSPPAPAAAGSPLR